MTDKMNLVPTKLSWSQKHIFYITIVVALTMLFYETYICDWRERARIDKIAHERD